MQQFFGGSQICFGLECLESMDLGRLLVVTDPYFYKDGTAQSLARGAAEVSYYYNVSPDPSARLAAEGTAAVKEFRPDTILALGGGSAMDCAKAMAYFSGTNAQLIAVPTTSGSGSEVTDFAILTHDGVKHPLVDPKLRPAVAVLDANLVAKLPQSLIADGGFDVLTHALEAYVAKNATPFSDALAVSAFRDTLNGLLASYRGDLEARGRVHYAATMAGQAFTNAGLGLCHALAHSLGGAFHVPHGRLNAILLPAVLAHSPSQKYGEMARLAGLEGRAEAVAQRNLRNSLVRLRRELALPSTLAEAGVSPAEVRKNAENIIKAAISDPCCDTNPTPVTADMARMVLAEVTGHG